LNTNPSIEVLRATAQPNGVVQRKTLLRPNL